MGSIDVTILLLHVIIWCQVNYDCVKASISSFVINPNFFANSSYSFLSMSKLIFVLIIFLTSENNGSLRSPLLTYLKFGFPEIHDVKNASHSSMRLLR